MEIEFSKEQYEALVQMVYLGNWMVNSIRNEDKVEKFEEIEQYIFSFYKKFGSERLVEHDEANKQYCPTQELEMGPETNEYIQDYEDEAFWVELAGQLANRDLLKEYGEEALEKMSKNEVIYKEQKLIEKYQMEFAEHSIDRLEIKKEI